MLNDPAHTILLDHDLHGRSPRGGLDLTQVRAHPPDRADPLVPHSNHPTPSFQRKPHPETPTNPKLCDSGLTAQQVSERAGITRDTLRKIESGNPNVSFNSVTQVLRALGILDQLVDAADPLASDIGRLRAGRLTRKRAR